MSYILIHNPNCSTSRKGLELLQSKGIEVDVRRYMSATQRLSVAELKEIAEKMGNVGPRAFLRESNAKKAGIPDDLSDAELYQDMSDNPDLIQRPIGMLGNKAVLGRPPERLLDIL